MPHGNTARNEDSVVVALQGLMGLEDERQRQEEEQRLLTEAAERERREEEQRLRREEGERLRRKEEEQRLAEERRTAEEAEQRRREDREQELRILTEAETRARIEDQERMLAFQLEMKRISSRRRGIPTWTIGAAAVVFLVIIGVGTAFHLSETSSYQQRIADLRGTAEQVENRATAEVERAQAELGQATARAVTAERLVNELRGKVATLEDRLQTLDTARSGARPRPSRGGGKPGRVERAGSSGGASPLSDDPLDDKFKID